MHRFAWNAALVTLAWSAAAVAEDALPLPADFHLTYAETTPRGRTLSFEVGADGAAKFRFDEAFGAEKIHEEGALALTPAAARRMAAALTGAASPELRGGEPVPNFFDAPEPPAVAKDAPRVELAARSGGRERSLALPWGLVDTAQEDAGKTDRAWTCLRLRLLELSGVAARVARAYLDRGGALLAKLDQGLGNLDAAALAQKLKGGLCAEEEEPYGSAHLFFMHGVEALDQTYDMPFHRKDDTANTLSMAEDWFGRRRFRGAAQFVQMVLAARLSWYEDTMKGYGEELGK